MHKNKLKYVIICMIILNIFYIYIINTLYFQLPVPNRIYLKDFNVGYPYYYIFKNILYLMIAINVLLVVIYIIKNKNNKR